MSPAQKLKSLKVSLKYGETILYWKYNYCFYTANRILFSREIQESVLSKMHFPCKNETKTKAEGKWKSGTLEVPTYHSAQFVSICFKILSNWAEIKGFFKAIFSAP